MITRLPLTVDLGACYVHRFGLSGLKISLNYVCWLCPKSTTALCVGMHNQSGTLQVGHLIGTNVAACTLMRRTFKLGDK